jgi:hypothetical protein
MRLRLLPFFTLMLVMAACTPPSDKDASGKPLARPGGASLRPEQPLEPFVIYHSGPALPQSWCDAWGKEAFVQIEQRPLVKKADGTWPDDGDLLIATPKTLEQLAPSIPLALLSDSERTTGINPAFLRHPFDPANQVTLPFRWSPWLLISTSDQKEAAFAYFYNWQENPRAILPDQPELLVSLRLKVESYSANNYQEPRRSELAAELAVKTAGRLASQEECWAKLTSRQALMTFLPATWRFMADPKTLPVISWAFPARGTLIEFEQLAIPQKSARHDKALALMLWLLHPEQQSRLLKETGFFQVKSVPGKETDGCPVPLPNAPGWFNWSEFIEAGALPIPIPMPAPAPLEPATATPVTPATTEPFSALPTIITSPQTPETILAPAEPAAPDMAPSHP